MSRRDSETVIEVGSQRMPTTAIVKWLTGKKFSRIEFDGPTEVYSTYSGRALSFKLVRREGFQTFVKGSYGGSIIVFEVARHDTVVEFDGYCPILVFGLWNKKVSFAKSAGFLTKYRQEGYEIREEFLAYLADGTL